MFLFEVVMNVLVGLGIGWLFALYGEMPSFKMLSTYSIRGFLLVLLSFAVGYRYATLWLITLGIG